MVGLTVIIVCIALSIICYKKMANRSRAKGRGKLSTFFIALSSSSLVFIVSMMIGISNFFPEAESSNSSEAGNIVNKTKATENESPVEQIKNDSKYTLLSKSPFENDNGDNDIVVKFDKNNPFEMSILKNIQSYQNASFKHNRAAMIFRDYGIDLRDFDKLVLPRCSQRVEELKSGYKRETEAWLPYSHYVNRDVLRKEKEYRDNYNREFSEKMQHESNIMNECFYSLSQKLPNHSPRNRPE